MLQPLLLLFALGAPPAFSAGVDQALAEQRDLPSYAARLASAQAQARAGERYFKGQGAVDQAFPELQGGDWLDPAWLSGRLALLDQAARARALEARDDFGDVEARTATRLTQSRDRALAAEESADAMQRRLLLSMEALLREYPGVQRASLEQGGVALTQQRSERTQAWETSKDAVEKGQLIEEIARLDQERARVEQLQGALLALAIQPNGLLDLSPEVQSLSDPLRAPFAARRITAALALSDGSAQEPLLDWLDGQRQQMESAEPRPVGDVDALRAALALVGLRLAQMGPDPISQAWGALGAVEQARLQDCLTRSQNWLLEQDQVDDEQFKNLEQAESAREEADQARAQAQDEAQRWVAQVLTSVADDYDVAAGYKERLDQQEGAYKAEVDAFQRQIEELSATLAPALSLSVLGGEREAAIDAVYARSRDLVQELRRKAIQSGKTTREREELAAQIRREAQASLTQLALDRDKVASVSDATQRAKVQERLDTWNEVLVQMDKIAAREEAKAFEHQVQVISLLERAKDLRAQMRGEVSQEQRSHDRSQLFAELNLELRVVVPRLLSLGSERLDTLRKNLRSVGFWGGLIWGLLKLAVGVVIWQMIRGRVAQLSERLLNERAKDQRSLERAATLQMVEPMALALRALLDLVAVWLLRTPVQEISPESGMLLLVALQVLLFRALVRLYALAVAKHPSTRPALVYASQKGFDLGERTLRFLLGWLIARQFVSYLTLEMLNADALRTLLMMGFTTALVGLCLMLLHGWEPTLRELMRRQGGDDRIRNVLTSEPARPMLTQWARAAADLVVLSSAWVWRQLQSRAGENSPLGRALNLFYRYSMSDKQEEESVGQPIPDSLVSAILAPDSLDPVPRPALDEVFYRALSSWEANESQGTLALVGDRGMGRSTWLHVICKDLADRGLGVRRMEMNRRILSEDELILWIAQELDLPQCTDLDGLEAALLERPESVLVIENAEDAFLREVGGFSAMRALFEIVGRLGEKHFWLLTFHLPAWAYLSRLQRLLKVHLFHHVLEVPPMTESQLRRLVVGRTEAAGFRVDFNALVRRGALSGDVDGQLERASVAFFRVLGEASLGNPAVAMRLWVESLKVTEEGIVQVRMGKSLREDLVDGLGEPELFLLSAIRMQNGLSEAELGSVNNMNAAAVRSSLQVLRGRGLLERERSRLQVNLRQQARITRTLWRRNLLDWRT
ncbi:MAG: hypothetical protein ACI9VR_000597 [Cognaticolwellia sp.]|jgi:hypothetical protein